MEKDFKLPFSIRLIEYFNDQDPIVHYTNSDENCKEIDEFILSLISLPNEPNLDPNLNNFITQSSYYENTYFIAFYFSYADVKAPFFHHKMIIIITSKTQLNGLENKPIYYEFTDFIKQQMVKRFEQFKKDVIVEYQKYSLIKKNKPEIFKQYAGKNTDFLSLIEKYKIPFGTDIPKEIEENYMDCFILNDDDSKSNNNFSSIFDMEEFSTKCNILINSFINWKYNRYYIENEKENQPFRIGEMHFNDFSKYIELNHNKIDQMTIKLLHFSKNRILNHLLYAINTGRTLIFKTNKYTDDVISFSKKLGMLFPFWNEKEDLKIFDKKINSEEAREFVISICPDFEGVVHNSLNFSYIDWDKSFFEGCLCPKDCFISSITNSESVSSESIYMLLLNKNLNDYADLFISLCAKYRNNVPTSYHRAKEVLDQLEFSKYDEDILLYWSHYAVSKSKRPILITFKNIAGHGIVAFKSQFPKQ